MYEVEENDGHKVLELVAEGDFRSVNLTVNCYEKDGTKSGNKVVEFELFEMDWLSQEKFLNQHNRRLTVTDDNVAVRDFEGMRLDLLTKAMRFKETGKLVTVEFFKAHRIPNSTAQALYDAAQELNQIQSADPTKWVKLVAVTLTKHALAGKITEEHKAILVKAMETEPAGE